MFLSIWGFIQTESMFPHLRLFWWLEIVPTRFFFDYRIVPKDFSVGGGWVVFDWIGFFFFHQRIVWNRIIFNWEIVPIKKQFTWELYQLEFATLEGQVPVP